MTMTRSNTLKILCAIVLSGALFTGGYFWGQNRMHQQMGATPTSGGGDMAGTKGMENMQGMAGMNMAPGTAMVSPQMQRSEEHTSELQSLAYLVCRLLLEKKKKKKKNLYNTT